MKKAGFLFATLVGLASADAFQAGAVMLTIYPGAKAVGMGGAFTGIADDPTCMFYNLGGLGFFRDMEVQLTHSPWLRTLVEDAYFDYFAGVFPTKVGVFGASVTYLTPGEVEIYNESGDYLGSFKPFDVAVQAGYGFEPLPDHLGVGMGFKVFYSYLIPDWVMREILNEPGGGKALTFAVDGGALYKTPIGINFGFNLSNFGPGVSYSGEGQADPLPWTLRLGFAWHFIRSEYHKLTLAADWHKVLVGLFDDLQERGLGFVLDEGWRSVGAEYSLYDMLYLRYGYFHDRYGYRMGYTFGGGISYGAFKLDIADDSAIYEFNKHNPDVKRNLRFTLTFVKAVNLGGGTAQPQGQQGPSEESAP